MQTIWKGLNGKKTALGAGLFMAAFILQKMLEIWWGSSIPDWGPKLVETLEWFGGIFSGIGLSHKGIKTWSPSNPSGALR